MLALAVVGGCGDPSDDDAGTSVGVSTSSAAQPAAPTPTKSPQTDSGVGTVVANMSLGVNALEAAATMPTAVEVTGADDLAMTYAGVPGLDPVVAAVADGALASGDRLFVYVVAACTTDDIALQVRGDEVVMVVSGTAALKCEPPPLQIVVWRVGADEVPIGAIPGQAIQK